MTFVSLVWFVFGLGFGQWCYRRFVKKVPIAAPTKSSFYTWVERRYDIRPFEMGSEDLDSLVEETIPHARAAVKDGDTWRVALESPAVDGHMEYTTTEGWRDAYNGARRVSRIHTDIFGGVHLTKMSPDHPSVHPAPPLR